MLSQAHIGTVDSFCAEMVREFFHLLDLSPDFKIVTDKQEEQLINASLNEVLTQAFEEGSVGSLADAFAGERDDRRLMDMVLSLYRFMQSHPFPERWLSEKVAMYFPDEADRQRLSPWERVLLDYAGERLPTVWGCFPGRWRSAGRRKQWNGPMPGPWKRTGAPFPKWRSWPGPETGTAFPSWLAALPRPGGAPCGVMTGTL